jgi:hypothetical protein
MRSWNRERRISRTSLSPDNPGSYSLLILRLSISLAEIIRTPLHPVLASGTVNGLWPMLPMNKRGNVGSGLGSASLQSFSPHDWGLALLDASPALPPWAAASPAPVQPVLRSAGKAIRCSRRLPAMSCAHCQCLLSPASGASGSPIAIAGLTSSGSSSPNPPRARVAPRTELHSGGDDAFGQGMPRASSPYRRVSGVPYVTKTIFLIHKVLSFIGIRARSDPRPCYAASRISAAQRPASRHRRKPAAAAHAASGTCRSPRTRRSRPRSFEREPPRPCRSEARGAGSLSPFSRMGFSPGLLQS